MEPESYRDYDLSILDPYLRDEATVEIAVNPDGHVWIERTGDAVMTRADLTLTVDQAHDLAGVIANTQDLTLTEQQPAISTTIEYRGVTLRCQAIVRPAAAIGPTLSFRIFRRRPCGVEPRRFAFLRGQGVSLEQERHEKLAHILNWDRQVVSRDRKWGCATFCHAAMLFAQSFQRSNAATRL